MTTSTKKQPLRAQRLLQRLLQHHLVLAVISTALILVGYVLVDSDNTMFRMSMATAYTSLALLGATLFVGPLNVLRSRPNPVSTDLRRDIGIWAGIVGLLHVVVGLQVHLRGKMLEYFFLPADSEQRLSPRYDSFGIANYSGLAATIVLALLLAISNDLALRALGTKRWKAIQYSNYGLLGLVVLHSIAYQLIEKRQRSIVILFGIMIGVVIAIQLAGFLRRRKAS